MNDNGGIRFDTTNVRGFAEYMHHLMTTKYEERAAKIRSQLTGGNDGGSDSRTFSDSGSGSMGSSGIEYYGLDIGKAEVENAAAGSLALKGIMDAWKSMAIGAAYAAEKFSGQDGDNAADLDKHIKPAENE